MKKKNNVKLTIILGVVCLLLTAAASWYDVTFNGSRLVKPIVLSEYVFRAQDLPMLVAVSLFCLYVIYLFVLLVQEIITNRAREEKEKTTRKLNPKLGLLGFLGFLGFAGFWTYSIDKTIFPFTFFIFFGFFGFFFEGKMSNTLMDERYKENKIRADLKANKISFTIIFLAMMILGHGRLMGNLEYTLIAFIIVVDLTLALGVFLSEYLLYRYDHDEQAEAGEE